MYANGIATNNIEYHIEEIYDYQVSDRSLEKIFPLVKEWQTRPLEAIYPIVFYGYYSLSRKKYSF